MADYIGLKNILKEFWSRIKPYFANYMKVTFSLNDGDDLNSITDNGRYQIDSKSVINAPTDFYQDGRINGFVDVQVYGDNVSQVIDIYQNGVYKTAGRKLSNTVWSDWNEIVAETSFIEETSDINQFFEDKTTWSGFLRWIGDDTVFEYYDITSDVGVPIKKTLTLKYSDLIYVNRIRKGTVYGPTLLYSMFIVETNKTNPIVNDSTITTDFSNGSDIYELVNDKKINIVSINDTGSAFPENGLLFIAYCTSYKTSMYSEVYYKASMILIGNSGTVWTKKIDTGNTQGSDWVENGYKIPETGIPKTDLSSDVQISLSKADTALQEHQDISGKLNLSGGTMTGALSATKGLKIPTSAPSSPSAGDIWIS